MCVFFFFKQKTAYEMRISDWSSDVCSSDLPRQRLACLILARRVTDHVGEIANQENRLVPLLLKRTKLIQQQSVAQMKILGGRVGNRLDEKSAHFPMHLPDQDTVILPRYSLIVSDIV